MGAHEVAAIAKVVKTLLRLSILLMTSVGKRSFSMISRVIVTTSNIADKSERIIDFHLCIAINKFIILPYQLH